MQTSGRRVHFAFEIIKNFSHSTMFYRNIISEMTKKIEAGETISVPVHGLLNHCKERW